MIALALISAHSYSHPASMLLGCSKAETWQKSCRHKRSKGLLTLHIVRCQMKKVIRLNDNNDVLNESISLLVRMPGNSARMAPARMAPFCFVPGTGVMYVLM